MIESGRIFADLIGPILLSMFHLGVKALKKVLTLAKNAAPLLANK